MLLDHLLFLTEAAEDGGGNGATGEPAAAPASLEPADPEAEPAGEPAAAAFDEQAFRQAVAEEAQAVVQAQIARMLPQPGYDHIPGATGGPFTGQGGFDWSQVDPYADDFGSQLGQGIQQTIQQALEGAVGPITQTLQQAQEAQVMARGEENAQMMIDAAITAGDDLTAESKSGVRALADLFMPQVAERYGNTPRAAEMAIQQAVDYFRQIERSAATRGATQQTNQLATLAGARSEPGASGGAAVHGMDGRVLSATELARKYAAG